MRETVSLETRACAASETTTPRGTVRGPGSQGLVNQPGDLFIADGPWSAGTQLVVQPPETLVEKPSSPVTHGHRVQAQSSGNGLVAHSRRAQQNDLGPQNQPVREAVGCGHGSELGIFLRVQKQRRLGSSHRHGHLHSSTDGAHNQMPKAILMLVIYATQH